MKRLYILLILMAGFTQTFSQAPVITPHPKEIHPFDFFSAIFDFDSSVKIVASKEKVDEAAVEFLKYQLAKKGITGNEVIYWSAADPVVPGKCLYLGIGDDYIDEALNSLSPHRVDINAAYPGKGGYGLQIMPPGAIISGSDKEGLLNGIRTFIQLWDEDRMPCLRIIDAPDYTERWFKYWNNLLVDKNVGDTKDMIERVSALKYNAMLFDDFKFSIISKMWKKYYDSVKVVDRFFDQEQLRFIPGVFPIGYSEAILYFNPNLATGLPVQAQKFVVKNDTALLVPSPKVSLKNGGFENYNGNNPTGFGYIDDPHFIDTDVKHSGKASLRFENFNQYGNARIIYTVYGKKFTQYRISGWAKTENLSPAGSINITAIGKRGLLHPELKIDATSDWKKFTLTFNSLDADTFNVYWGVWGARDGKIWWDDIELEEESFVNLVRREGAPLNISHQIKDIAYLEGKDYDSLYDTRLLKNQIDFWHEPPYLTIPEGSSIIEGDTLMVSYYHTVPIYWGQTMTTLSDPEVEKIMDSQFKMLDSLITTNEYYMGHDEIRIMGWDAGDEARGMTPAQMIAENINLGYDIIQKYNPGAKVWMWSDMVDEFHNAVEGPYYLVKGSLKGSAPLISKQIGIINWNSGMPDSSLKFFERLGFRQIGASFIDGGVGISRMWIEKGRNIKDFMGMVYVTWADNYDLAEEQAEYGWNHAPYILHDAPVKQFAPRGIVKLPFKIVGDPYNPTWALENAILFYRTHPAAEFEAVDLSELEEFVELNLAQDNEWLQYYLTADDKNGNVSRLPFGENHYFELGQNPVPVAEEADEAFKLMAYPQPAAYNLNLVYYALAEESISIKISDIRGGTVMERNMIVNPGSNVIRINIDNLAAGTYNALIIARTGATSQRIIIE